VLQDARGGARLAAPIAGVTSRLGRQLADAYSPAKTAAWAGPAFVPPNTRAAEHDLLLYAGEAYLRWYSPKDLAIGTG